VFANPLDVYVTRSIEPAIGLQTKPIIPLPNPLAPPLNPFVLDYLIGSRTTPETALANSFNIDLVPLKRPYPT
jgi:hypothetical protein